MRDIIQKACTVCFVLFLYTTSIADPNQINEETLALHKQIATLTAKIAKLETVVESQKAEIAHLRVLCQKNGINTEMSKLNEKRLNAPDVNSIVSKPIFGVHLGESIKELKKRYKLTKHGIMDGSEDLHEMFTVTPCPATVSNFCIGVFNDRVAYIILFISDATEMNYAAIKNKLREMYRIENENLENPFNKTWGFTTTIDGVPVFIQLQLKDGFSDSNKLSLMYTHQPLQDMMQDAIKKAKADKIADQL